MTVGAILIIHTPENKIAIAASRAHIAVIRIFTLRIDDAHPGNGAMQDFDLFQKWDGVISVHAKTQSIPFVAPPFVHLVDRERSIYVIHGNNFLSRKITRAMVEMEKIPKHQPSLSPAIWTINGFLYVHCLIEVQFRLRDLVSATTVVTGLTYGKWSGRNH